MDFDFSDSLTHLMHHVLKLHRQNVDLLIQEYDVFPGQPPLLMRLAEKDGQIQSELARKIHVKPATLTVMINRMEKAGLLERRQDAEDHRVSRVYLTDKGRLAESAVKDALRVIESKSFEHFSLEEKLLFRRLLQQMYDDLKAFKNLNSLPAK